MLDLTLIRQKNLSKILRHLHFFGPQRRTSLSEALGIRLNSMNSLMLELSEKKLIDPQDPERPRGYFALNTQASWVFVVRTGQDGVSMGIMNFLGQISATKHLLQTQWKIEDFATMLQAQLQEFIKIKAGPPLGCGLAMTGIVQEGILKRSIFFGPWNNQNLQALLTEKLGVNTLVDNDTRCAARSQHWFPTDRSENKSVFLLALGHGISSAMMFDGQVHNGGQGSAGEIGHIPIEHLGKICPCGKSDCLETYCRSDAVLQELNALLQVDPPLCKLEDIVEWSHRHPAVGNIIDRVGQNLCKVLVPIIAALDTDTMLLMTDDLQYSALVCHALNRHFDRILIGHDAHAIKWSPLGDLKRHQLKGAGAMVMESLFAGDLL